MDIRMISFVPVLLVLVVLIDINLERSETIGSMYDVIFHGNVNFTVGPRGQGKTHEVVRHAYVLKEKYDIDHFITNIMWDGDLDGKPIYFVTSFKDLWKKIAEIRMDSPQENIMVMIDEFQETVHRFRSTSSSSVIFDRWFRQLRKQNITANMITQNTYSSIPVNILYQGDYIFMKKKEMVDELNNMLELEQLRELNDRRELPKSWNKWLHPSKVADLENDPRFGIRFWKPPEHPQNQKPQGVWDKDGRGKALTFCVDISQDIYDKVSVEKQDISQEDIREFREYKITLHDVDQIIKSDSCPWTDPEEPGPTYNTNAHATFYIFPLADMKPQEWVPQFMKAIGSCDTEDAPQIILDFFKEHESESGLSLTPFEELSDSRKAVLIYEISRLTDGESLSMRQAAGVYGLSKSSIRKAKERWDDYLMEEHIDAIVNDSGSGQDQSVDGRMGGRVHV